MLCNVDEILVEDAQRILTLLCFAVRPLTVHELIDGIAVEIHGSRGLNRKRRLQDADDIRRICPGLIEIGQDATQAKETYQEEKYIPTVRIAHFSVQEYLRSERIRHQKAAIFSLNSDKANSEVAQICLTYLLERDLTHSILDQSLLEEFPLARFAAEYWHHYYREAVKSASEVEILVLTLFQDWHSFTTSIKIYDADSYQPAATTFNRTTDGIASPIYYTSLLGLDKILPALLDSKQVNPIISPHAIASALTFSQDVNAQGGCYGNALQAASFQGYEKVVHMLLDNGAEINAQGGCYGNALQAASAKGHEKMVQMLLDRGAEINAQGGCNGNVLQAASAKGHEKVVQKLLDAGANVNAPGTYGAFGNALQSASFGGHESVVRILLKYGATTGPKDMQGRCIFLLACAGGKMSIVKMMLRFTQDCRVVDKQGRNGLHHAASTGSTEVVKWLLNENICPNEADRDGWTPLHWAAKNGRVETINFLRNIGVNCKPERINEWTPEMVALFHHNQYPSALNNDAENEPILSELASQEGNDHLAASTRMVSKGKDDFGVSCDGCDLVSLVSNTQEVRLSDLSSAYMVHATNVQTVTISIFVLNA